MSCMCPVSYGITNCDLPNLAQGGGCLEHVQQLLDVILSVAGTMVKKAEKKAPTVPESVLKRRKRDEDWAAKKAATATDAKKKARDSRKDIFKRAESYVKEYRDQVRPAHTGKLSSPLQLCDTSHQYSVLSLLFSYRACDMLSIFCIEIYVFCRSMGSVKRALPSSLVACPSLLWAHMSCGKGHL